MSAALVVGHVANFTACSRVAACFFPSAVLPVMSIFSMLVDLPPALGRVGVGHDEQPLSNVRWPEGDGLPPLLISTHEPSPRFLARARSAQIGGPNSISQDFQRTTHSGEPCSSVSARNLLSKDRCRAALGDEPPELREKVPPVGKP